jgi:hypothetical protein
VTIGFASNIHNRAVSQASSVSVGLFGGRERISPRAYRSDRVSKLNVFGSETLEASWPSFGWSRCPGSLVSAHLCADHSRDSAFRRSITLFPDDSDNFLSDCLIGGERKYSNYHVGTGKEITLRECPFCGNFEENCVLEHRKPDQICQTRDFFGFLCQSLGKLRASQKKFYRYRQRPSSPRKLLTLGFVIASPSAVLKALSKPSTKLPLPASPKA